MGRILLFMFFFMAAMQQNKAVEYYVNSVSGSDSNSGTSTNEAWQTLAPVQAKAFQPGDVVNFARGSVWTKAAYEFIFIIDDNGTAENPITFKAYGTGNKPSFSNGGNRWNSGINITADYVIVEDILVTNTGYKGFNIASGADYNIIRNCEVSNTGVAFYVTGSNNLLTKNYIHDLIMVVDDTGSNCSLPKTDPLWNRNPCDNDFGCVSFWLYGPNNEISYNRSINNRGHSYDYQYDGGFLEFYNNCDGTYAHHNWAEKGQGIIEASNGHGNNITVSHNVFIEHMGMFALHLSGFTISNFKFENNTCITREGTLWNNMFMTPNGMIIRNNIFVLGGDASERVGNTNSFTHTNNLYYLLDGAQMGSVSATDEKLADPKFVDMSSYKFELLAGSPAINAGIDLGYKLDYANRSIPVGGAFDIGAYEFDITSGLPEIKAENRNRLFIAYPNPAIDNVNVTLLSADDNTPVEIEIFDLQARLVIAEKFNARTNGQNTFKIDVSSLSKGTYLIKCSLKNSLATSSSILVKY